MVSTLPQERREVVLRPYQQKAVAALIEALSHGEFPVCMIATGGGKSVVIATLCDRLPGRILVATHRQELLQQNAATLARWGRDDDFCTYSAGLGIRETDARVVFGGIQSIYRRMDALQAAGPFAHIIVDEAHLVPPPSVDSMYGQVFRACGGARRIGFTATPYRMDAGLLHEGDDTWFTTMPVQIGITELTAQGYLAPLAGVLTAQDVDTSQVRMRAGEFAQNDLAQAASEPAVIAGAVDELCTLAAQRHSWLVFCVDVLHSQLVTYALQERGITAACLVGTTPHDERQRLLHRFRQGTLRALVNCQVATTGFDIAAVDCIAMLRPTMSKALCVQMLGRGTRLAPEKKTDCLILDMAGNLERHRPLDGLEVIERSPKRQAKDAAETEARERQARERRVRHGQYASLLDPATDAQEPSIERLRVLACAYRQTPSKKYPNCTNLMVGYKCRGVSGTRWINQWICLEYGGWAGAEAAAWFRRRGVSVPSSTADALADAARYPQPTHIVVRHGGQFPRILQEHFPWESADDE